MCCASLEVVGDFLCLVALSLPDDIEQVGSHCPELITCCKCSILGLSAYCGLLFCVFGDVFCVTSSMHMFISPVTIAAYCEMNLVAISLKILQSVHSLQSWYTEVAPAGQTLI